MSNYSIYTSKGQLVVETVLCNGGVQRDVKSEGGECAHYFKPAGLSGFRKTGWGKSAERSFAKALADAQKQLRAAA